jgi:hypothetical protein
MVEYESHKDLFDFLTLEKECIGQTCLVGIWFNTCMKLFWKPQNFMLERLNICHLLDEISLIDNYN